MQQFPGLNQIGDLRLDCINTQESQGKSPQRQHPKRSRKITYSTEDTSIQPGLKRHKKSKSAPEPTTDANAHRDGKFVRAWLTMKGFEPGRTSACDINVQHVLDLAACMDRPSSEIFVLLEAELAFQKARPQKVLPTHPAPHKDPQILAQRYAQEAATRGCDKTDRKRNCEGVYQCVFGECDYRINKADGLMRHMAVRQPTTVYICNACQTTSVASTFVHHRKDKFRTHVKALHKNMSETEAIVNEEKSTFHPKPNDNLRCGFCQYQCIDFKLYHKHVVKHFTQGNLQEGGRNWDIATDWVFPLRRSENEDDASHNSASEDDSYIGSGASTDDDSGDDDFGSPPDGGRSGGANGSYQGGSSENQGRDGSSGQNGRKANHQNSSSYTSHGSGGSSWVFASGMSLQPLDNRPKDTPFGLLIHMHSLGRGAHGTVDKVKVLSNGLQYARKRTIISRKLSSIREAIMREIEILKILQHANIPRLVFCYEEASCVNIIMEPAAEMNLKEFLDRPQKNASANQQTWSWISDLAKAVSYLHAPNSKNMIVRHGDIKPANILVDCSTAPPKLLLADFGVSKVVPVDESESSSTCAMTPMYAAPEILDRKPHGRKADVWSLGCVFLELVTFALNGSLDGLTSRLDSRSEAPPASSPPYSTKISEVHTWLHNLRDEADQEKQLQLLIVICALMLSACAPQRPTAGSVSHHVENIKDKFSDHVLLQGEVPKDTDEECNKASHLLSGKVETPIKNEGTMFGAESTANRYACAAREEENMDSKLAISGMERGETGRCIECTTQAERKAADFQGGYKGSVTCGLCNGTNAHGGLPFGGYSAPSAIYSAASELPDDADSSPEEEVILPSSMHSPSEVDQKVNRMVMSQYSEVGQDPRLRALRSTSNLEQMQSPQQVPEGLLDGQPDPTETVTESLDGLRPSTPSSQSTEDGDKRSLVYCQAMFDFDQTKRDPEKLDLRKGDIIRILRQDPSGWWYGVRGEAHGWFPGNFCVLLEHSTSIALQRHSGQAPQCSNAGALLSVEDVGKAAEGWRKIEAAPILRALALASEEDDPVFLEAAHEAQKQMPSRLGASMMLFANTRSLIEEAAPRLNYRNSAITDTLTDLRGLEESLSELCSHYESRANLDNIYQKETRFDSQIPHLTIMIATGVCILHAFTLRNLLSEVKIGRVRLTIQPIASAAVSLDTANHEIRRLLKILKGILIDYHEDLVSVQSLALVRAPHKSVATTTYQPIQGVKETSKPSPTNASLDFRPADLPLKAPFKSPFEPRVQPSRDSFNSLTSRQSEDAASVFSRCSWASSATSVSTASTRSSNPTIKRIFQPPVIPERTSWLEKLERYCAERDLLEPDWHLHPNNACSKWAFEVQIGGTKTFSRIWHTRVESAREDAAELALSSLTNAKSPGAKAISDRARSFRQRNF
ncbi:MAG: hypothetical protein M1820_007994 [Bogoriella megaspora]|nr:MAG: hypothetical protein M1820_007994 [Bogoriella megaspora]